MFDKICRRIVIVLYTIALASSLYFVYETHQLIVRVDGLIEKVSQIGSGLEDTVWEQPSVAPNDKVVESVVYNFHNGKESADTVKAGYGVNHLMVSSYIDFVDGYMNDNGCKSYDIVEVCEDSYAETYGVSIGLIFDNGNYVCVWVDNDSKVILLYECPLSESLIENWEYI